MPIYTAIENKMFPTYKFSEFGLINECPKRKPIIDILTNCGLDDALHSINTLIPNDKDKIVLYAIRCAENVLHIFENVFPNEKAPRLAIEAAKDCLNGNSDIKKLEIVIKAVSKVAVETAKIPHAAWAAWAACSAAETARFSLSPHVGHDHSGEIARGAGESSRNARESRRALGKDMADFAGETNNKGDAERAAEMEFQLNLFKGIFGKTNNPN